QRYVGQLQQMDATFRDVIGHAKRKTLLFGDRFPFRYFADEYGLKYYAAFTGCSVETEASAAPLAFLIGRAKKEHIPVVFTIEFSNGKIADAISDATGARKMTLYSYHNLTRDQLEAGETVLGLMQKNIDSLKTALY
ncbi:MAG: zinc ABC transporter substrate-binding protein, partial [Oxalobacter sp.]|nr:zinc ABC transporter substrate-binding protein [Oxalobacter sp.]